MSQVVEWVERRFERGYAPIIVVAEGAVPSQGEMVVKDASQDAFGHVRLSGIGDWLARELEERTGHQARTTVLGYVQRGGTPTSRDRVLATRFGVHAVDAINDGDFGKMTALRGTDIVRVPLADAVAELKTVPPELYAEAATFFG
jgi:6-phosphofructokinase 1